MTSAFVWAVSGVARRHLTGAVAVSVVPDGETYEVLGDDGAAELVVDVRGVWLALDVETTAPGGLAGHAGGEGLALGEVWLALLGGAAVEYRPNADAPAVSVPVVPDIGHKATLLAVQAGCLLPGLSSLRLRSRLRYAPGDPVLGVAARTSAYNPAPELPPPTE